MFKKQQAKLKGTDIFAGPPMDRNDLLEEYQNLCRLADERVKNLERQLAASINCKPGCHTCCQLSSVLPLEALAMRQAVDVLDVRLRKLIRRHTAEVSSEFCPLLHEGLCLIYEHRPLICRTHGLPVAYVDYERQCIEVSACPLNFPADFPLQEKQLLFMDELNLRLRQLNGALGLGEAEERVSILDIVLEKFVCPLPG